MKRIYYLLFTLTVIWGCYDVMPNLFEKFLIFGRSIEPAPNWASYVVLSIFALFSFLSGLIFIGWLKEKRQQKPTILGKLIVKATVVFISVTAGLMSATAIYLFKEYLNW